VTITGSIIIGFFVSIFCYFAISTIKTRFGYDDALDVFGVHAVGGAWGALATGIFAAPFINSLGTGALYGNPGQILTQIIGIAVVAGYTFIMTIIIAKVIDKTMGLRVDLKEEVEGLDTHLHEESGYRI
jgi:Amt family ammonium transporter